MIRFFEQAGKEVRAWADSESEGAYGVVERKFKAQAAALKKQTSTIKDRLHYLFMFAEQAFEQGNEMLILVTELTVNDDSARFIAIFGCPDYQKHNAELMLSERQNKFVEEINQLDI